PRFFEGARLPPGAPFIFFALLAKPRKTSCKILLPPAASSFSSGSRLSRLFWGEQPPFTPIGRGGRYFFGVELKITPKAERRISNIQCCSQKHRAASLGQSR